MFSTCQRSRSPSTDHREPQRDGTAAALRVRSGRGLARGLQDARRDVAGVRLLPSLAHASLVGQGCAREPTRRACCTGRGHGDAARGRPAPQLPSSRGLTTAMDGRRRKTVHAARRPEERPKDASHSSTFTECTAAMLTLPSFAGPTSARSVTRSVRMRFSVGTGRAEARGRDADRVARAWCDRVP